jgi:hypothetical protein
MEITKNKTQKLYRKFKNKNCNSKIIKSRTIKAKLLINNLKFLIMRRQKNKAQQILKKDIRVQ